MMCVVILSTTMGTKYFDSNHMEKVEAVGAVVVVGGITLATIAEICLFVGTVALAAYGIHEGYENREEIARFGKEFIDSCGETAEGWVMQIVDASGQDYVFGSEALELVRNTEWSVIQGGLPPEGDPNKKDDKDKDKFHIPGDPMTHVAQFTALGATWFSVNAKNIYQDWCDILDGWVGKDTPIPENNVLANNFPQAFTDKDVESQSSGYLYDYKWTVAMSYMYKHPYSNPQHKEYRNIASAKKTGRVAGIKQIKNGIDGNGRSYTDISCSVKNINGTINGIGKYIFITNGEIESQGDNYAGNAMYGFVLHDGSQSCDSYSGTLTFGGNFPIFTDQEMMEYYLETGQGYENALNYSKDYRIADWLQQDWAGELIDPLVNIGLSLTQLIELMKALGLKVLQGLSAAELLDLLKNALPKLNPDLNPGAVPSPAVNPALDPIYYPDPDAHPDKPPRPVIDPDPSPNPDPKPDPNPKPDPDPDPDPVPLPDMDAADYQVDLKSIFPFCIPFDFIDLLKALDAKPRAPCFTFPVVIPALEYREDVKLDMSIFDDVAKVIRLCEKVSFILFLMFVTSKVIRW